MIFIYPALVSKNIDWKVYPAISKAIEKFFLLQIGESFGSGVLRIKTKWDPRKDRYSELMLENLKIPENMIGVGSLLSESKITDEVDELTDKIQSSKQELDDKNSELKQETLDLTILIQNQGTATSKNVRSSSRQDIQSTKDRIASLKGEIQTLKDTIKKDQDRIKSIIDLAKYDDEREQIEKEKYKGRASYEIVKTKGIGLEPTMANLRVKIMYQGGPAAEERGRSGSIDSEEISIGVQLIPSVIQKFEDFQHVLLDDYFSKKSEMMFKTLYRDILRTSDKVIDKIYQFILGRSRKKKGDPDVKRDILLAPRGFVDASSFTKKANSPKFHSYAAAILMFNKEDISDEYQEENIFENQQHLQKLFRVGWNTFCMIDNTQEEIVFASMLDGGLVHRISFSYLFHSADAKDIYDNLDLLKRAATPFKRSIGGIKNIGKIVARENSLVRCILDVLNG